MSTQAQVVVLEIGREVLRVEALQFAPQAETHRHAAAGERSQEEYSRSLLPRLAQEPFIEELAVATGVMDVFRRNEHRRTQDDAKGPDKLLQPVQTAHILHVGVDDHEDFGVAASFGRPFNRPVHVSREAEILGPAPFLPGDEGLEVIGPAVHAHMDVLASLLRKALNQPVRQVPVSVFGDDDYHHASQ